MNENYVYGVTDIIVEFWEQACIHKILNKNEFRIEPHIDALVVSYRQYEESTERMVKVDGGEF